MTAEEAVARRLRNERLTGTPFRRPDQVVAWFGAVQAQDYAGARWAVAQRMAKATDAQIEAAFDAGRILRTHVLRPTWHFVVPADIRWLLRLTGPRVQRGNQAYYRSLGLDARTLARTITVIVRALESGQYLTRQELGNALAASGIHGTGQRLACIAMNAELEAVICSGPRRGKQFTYALVDERAPAAHSIAFEGDDALAELAVRYFTSHGPATIRDFVWWSGLTTMHANTGAAAAGRRLTRVEIGDRICFACPTRGRDSSPAPDTPLVHLLPNYDEFLIAFKDRDWSVVTKSDVRFGPTLEFPHQLCIDGRVAGSWRRRLEAGAAHVEVVPLRPFGRPEAAAVRAATERYAAFLERPVTVSVRAR